MRSLSSSPDVLGVKPPSIHPAQKWIFLAVFGALTVGQGWLTAHFVERQPDLLAVLFGTEVCMEAAFAAGLWVVLKQCSIVLTENGVTWGFTNPRRFIAWKDAELQIEWPIVVVRSGGNTLKINSAHYSEEPFWRFFDARFPHLHVSEL